MVSWGSQSVLLAQEPEWVWAKGFGGSEADGTRDMVIDNSGNIYMVGQYISEEMDFGTFTLTTDDYSHYVVKFNSDGEAIWGKTLGDGIETAIFTESIAVDSENNVYISGSFRCPWTFANTTVYSNVHAVYLAKYDSDGNEQWVKTGSDTYSYSTHIKIDSEDRIIIAGQFEGTLFLDSIALTSKGFKDVLIVSYDKNGNLIWAKSCGGNREDIFSDITIDFDNNIILTGYFNSTSFKFGSNSYSKYNSDPYAYDLFIVKYDSSGLELWGKNAGGEEASAYGVNITANEENSIYLSGGYWGPSIYFDSITLSSSQEQTFIFKINSDGTINWGENIFGLLDETISFTYANSALYMVGSSENSTIDFGNFILNNNVNGWYFFIAKMNEEEEFEWAIATGRILYASVARLAVNAADIYFSAPFEPAITIGSTTLISNGKSDFLLAKLTDTTVGIDDFENSAFTFCPNPFSTQATLFSGKELHNATLTIINTLGQLVKRMENLNGNSVTINRENLVAGIYYWILTENQEVLTAKKISIQ